jgi:hypothetical protein
MPCITSIPAFGRACVYAQPIERFPENMKLPEIGKVCDDFIIDVLPTA